MKILFTFLTEKKNLFWTNKKFVYLIFINKLSWYHPKITYENIVQKNMDKFLVFFLKKSFIFCGSKFEIYLSKGKLFYFESSMLFLTENPNDFDWPKKKLNNQTSRDI